jgi:sortase family protein
MCVKRMRLAFSLRSLALNTLMIFALAACSNTGMGATSGPPASSTIPATMSGKPISTPVVDPTLDLHSPPVAVPLDLMIPALNVDAPVLAVGLTRENVMDAPKGPPGDSVWQKAFWYRGGAVPGSPGTATMAGHVTDAMGHPSIFGRLNELHSGDEIIMRDTRNGQLLHFAVVASESYTAQQSADPAILARVYGSGPLSGRGAQPDEDGRSHLALITCAGDYVDGSYDHRLVVYAVGTQ